MILLILSELLCGGSYMYQVIRTVDSVFIDFSKEILETESSNIS